MRRLLWLVLASLGCVGDPALEADRAFTAGVARVERVRGEVVTSPPAFARVIVSGHLPDACTELDEVETRRRGFEIEVTLTTRRSFGVTCPPLERAFQKSINLPVDSYASGLYIITVNGVRASVASHTSPFGGDLLERRDLH
jgi:inhibitor of cysteine peptidase